MSSVVVISHDLGLIHGGFIRKLSRAIQNWRKEIGIEVDDRVSLTMTFEAFAESTVFAAISAIKKGESKSYLADSKEINLNQFYKGHVPSNFGLVLVSIAQEIVDSIYLSSFKIIAQESPLIVFELLPKQENLKL